MTPNPSLERLLDEGRNELDRGNYTAALATFHKAAALEPQNPQVLYGLGLACDRLEQYQDAVEYLNQALEIQPNYILALARRGLAYKELKQTPQAEADFERVIAIAPQDADDWYARGIALGNLGRYEDEIASYDQALTIQPNDQNSWYCRGIALKCLGLWREALISWEKVLEINPNDPQALNWYGNALDMLDRFEEAITIYDKAIEIQPNHEHAWYNRGNVLNKLGRYSEAIASYDKALRLTDYQDWQAWYGRGAGVFYSQDYKAAVKTWDDGIKALKPQTPDYQQGCGELYREKAYYLYEYAKEESNPFPDWFAAKFNYEQALNFLTFDKFPQRHMQVLQELLQVCTALGDTQTFNKRQEEATQRLEQLLVECEFQGQKISLARQFAALNQLRVDIHIQSTNKQEHIEALELAERRKNTCLAWLQSGWDYQPPNFNYQDMQKLLNSKTAAVYWHISPNAITTFIIKHNQPPLVLSPQISSEKRNTLPFNNRLQENTTALGYLNQLNRFQNWMQEWKQTYQDYCQGNYNNGTKETSPWRENMEYMLLNRLRDILEINRIRDNLKDIDQLILIPHRELHLLPLDYLFPGRFNITYLPSFQIGLKLIAQPSYFPLEDNSKNIVNVANSELPFDNIESVAISSLYPECRQLELPPVTQKALITALQENKGLFHFTGHGDHIPEEPLKSYLMLTKVDKLTFEDIVKKLDLTNYELICLSACETGITSQHSLTDEYIGLVSGFLAKGAQYVVNSLWTVDERSTAILMIKFYELLKQNQTPATALKQAKEWLCKLTYESLVDWYRELVQKLNEPQCREYLKTEIQMIENNLEKMALTEPVYAHPYYWAGFILTGKPATIPTTTRG
jgi:CHAT domain-containing protein/Flp pilus assembly protein TadD